MAEALESLLGLIPVSLAGGLVVLAEKSLFPESMFEPTSLLDKEYESKVKLSEML
mgnify:CR=1 FL=1